MNYYKTNNNYTHFYEYDINPVIVKPMLDVYTTYSNKSHDDLFKCHCCHVKYDIQDLIRVSVGKFICVFCFKVGA
jgi:hypothetical protein